MKKLFVLMGFIVIGIVIIVASSSHIYAQGDDDKEFVGSRECTSCHRDIGRSHEESPHALALTSDRDDEFWIADFDAGAEIRNVVFSDSEERAFEKDDIVYALGMGRYVQRYLYELDRDEYVVFPAEWNALTGEWQPYGPVENWPEDPAYDFGTSCAGCHTTGLTVRRTRWEDDGVQCEACHGGGSVHVEEAEDAGDSPSDREYENIREAIVLSPSAEICGQCHNQGMTADGDYKFPTEYVVGSGNLLDEDEYVLVSLDSDVHWWSTGHAASTNMQYNEWLNSAHATSLETAQESDYAEESCLACHSSDYRFTESLLALHEEGERDGDPPEAITLETAAMGVTCVTCHNPHTEPDEVDFFLRTDTYTMCTECHSDSDASDGLHHPVQQMFEGQTVVAEVEGVPSTHFLENENGGPLCVTCHMPRVPMDGIELASHQLNPIHPGEAANLEGLEDSCSTCHGEDVEPDGLQAFIDQTQNSTQTRYEAIQVALTGDQAEWVDQSLAFIEGDGSWGVHNYAYTDQLLDAVEIEIGLAEAPVFDPAAVPTSAVIVDTTIEEAADSEFADTGVAPIGLLIMAISLVTLAGAAYIFFVRQEANDE